MSDIQKSVADVEEIRLTGSAKDDIGEVKVRYAGGKTKKEAFVEEASKEHEETHPKIKKQRGKDTPGKAKEAKDVKEAKATKATKEVKGVKEVQEVQEEEDQLDENTINNNDNDDDNDDANDDNNDDEAEDEAGGRQKTSSTSSSSFSAATTSRYSKVQKKMKSKIEKVLDDFEDSNSDNTEETLFDEDNNEQWYNTMLVIHDVIEPKLIEYFHKYLNKPSNQGRIWQPSMTSLDDEDEDEDEETEDEELSDGEQVVDEEFRKCQVATDTNTLTKLYSMLDEMVDAAVDRYISKYNHFSIVSTKEEYTMLKFEKDDFFAEHIECNGFNDDDGAARRLAVFIPLQKSKKGGDFHFIYQGEVIRPIPGSILIFPSCPLHPLEVTPVEEGTMIYVCNYLM